MPEWTPLSARSVVLSLLLGAHPRPMTARELGRAGEHVGISVATVRVALTRAVATGDLRRDGAGYHLGARLLERRRRDEDHAAVLPWDGTWEMAVVVGTGRPSGDRAALRGVLLGARLAELREGVWLRPANLGRPCPTTPALQTYRARPTGDPVELAAELWDLRGWVAETTRTLGHLAGVRVPATRLAVAAQLVRHLATDPLLPPELWPVGWPAPRAREVYAAYQQELLTLGA